MAAIGLFWISCKKAEEKPVNQFIEQSILDSAQEAAAVTFEEPVKTIEKAVESIASSS